MNVKKTISARNVQTICNIKYINFGLRSQVVNIGSWSYVFNPRFELPVPGSWILSPRSWVWRPSPFSNYYEMWQKLLQVYMTKCDRFYKVWQKIIRRVTGFAKCKKGFWKVCGDYCKVTGNNPIKHLLELFLEE